MTAPPFTAPPGAHWWTYYDPTEQDIIDELCDCEIGADHHD